MTVWDRGGMTLDPRSPSMNLWHRLLAAGVSEEEATTLMHGYAHELADRQRAWIEERADMPWWVDEIPDIIDPEAQRPPVGEYRLSSRPGVVGADG
ncbi:hypothetical protein [Streptomyces sp. NPDC088794]|uniref:hypothetical protein n=1 Tax=Streptomyces sp. NPDC088794 TaxID=3365902 RepID=UPI00381D47A6